MTVKNIYLHGALGDEFGSGPFKVAARTPFMITRVLIGILGVKFRQMISEGRFHLLKGKVRHWKTGKGLCSIGNAIIGGDLVEKDIGEDEVSMGFSAEELHYIPAVEGSGNAFRIILGVALIVADSLVFHTGYLTSLGIGLALGGIVGLLTPVAKVTNSDYNANQLASNIFQGQQNVTTQGVPVPLVFGRFLCGSVVISAGIEAEDVSPT